MDIEADPEVAPIDLLLEQHRALDDVFARHQEALIERQWVQATQLLEEYQCGLQSHIELEERDLLPRCEVMAGVRWSSTVYQAEHRRIEQLLHKAIDRLIRAQAAEITPRTLIALLDEERVLKHLVEHHHEREEKALFVELGGAQA